MAPSTSPECPSPTSSGKPSSSNAGPIRTHFSSNVFNIDTDTFAGFIDAFMKKCGFLHKERQDFVTYWGPQLTSTPFIAIRFLAPKEYQDAAKLDVEVKEREDVRVVRLFALFCNLTEAGNGDANVDEQVAVLLEEKSRPDVGREFCVFEWGGMIVR
ncbi:hypothetical protein K440DRAFT_663677 [Wilcoxina mikolae CBS 423.85]|nr:hypothetical protein K440DRAFT_663677 [Wilcoxina mikolae CBS 423.85]